MIWRRKERMSKDKELSQKLPLIPFGKYKGQPGEVLKQDPKYVEWLKGQDWFSSQHKSIYTLIVNNFGIASETPEHNEMQVKFLDEWYRLKLAYVIVGDKLFKCNRKYFEDRLSAFLALVGRGIEERERGLENIILKKTTAKTRHKRRFCFGSGLPTSSDNWKACLSRECFQSAR
jgi:hypothetical protein